MHNALWRDQTVSDLADSTSARDATSRPNMNPGRFVSRDDLAFSRPGESPGQPSVQTARPRRILSEIQSGAWFIPLRAINANRAVKLRLIADPLNASPCLPYSQKGILTLNLSWNLVRAMYYYVQITANRLECCFHVRIKSTSFQGLSIGTRS